MIKPILFAAVVAGVMNQCGHAPSYDTPIPPEQERAFAQWRAINAPGDSGEDYDLGGAFLAGVRRVNAADHMPDTFKKPNHLMFSDESQYAKFAPERAGHWIGDSYVKNPAR